MTFLKFLFSKTFLKQLIIAFVAVVVICFVLLRWLESSTNQGDHITVPNLATLTLDKVDRKLEALNLRREVLDSANFNPDYPPYSVIDQAPNAGKHVKENRKIYLTLNPSGYKMIEIPDNLIRRTRRQVEPTLLSLGFKIGSISYRPDVARDAVLELRHKGKRLEPGDKLMKTSTIDLILGDGSGNYGRDTVKRQRIEERTMNDLEDTVYDF